MRVPTDKKTADDEIAQRAVKLIEWNITLPPGAVKVKVEHGIVNLDGIVDWDYQRTEAEYDVRKLGGVKGVLNELTVRPRVNSGDIRAQLIEAFERSAAVEANRITVEVVGVKVVLSGEVDSWIERQEAERAAWSVPGVVSVEDYIAFGRP